jgi:hypothetical protein
VAEFDTVQDSGKHKQYEDGAVRDATTGKGRFDLLSPLVLRRDAKHMENGATKYAARNWEKGMPLSRCFDSAMRHLNEYMRCRMLGIDMPEDHLAAARWNIGALIHFEELIADGQMDAKWDDLPIGKE